MSTQTNEDTLLLSPTVNRLPVKGPTTGSIIGGIIGVILLLALIATAVVLFRKHRNNAKNRDDPPNYKPPPPKKTGGSAEMLNPSTDPMTHAQPPNSMYYETSREPVTNLDAYSDEETGYNDDSSPTGWGVSAQRIDDEGPDESAQLYDEPPSPTDYHGNADEREPNPAPSRGDSFMSPAMYV
ncbi:hypothetical protein AGOR_G00207040 [Albula goreensis]|uniref:Uncharacterized protein n=1 Tax=Albula goreensis TaxID=1534307 RepID=A0A8T3CQC7_9TELE|nr:hypothetical protein AGOR_G00207040 [Albula goreensis]